MKGSGWAGVAVPETVLKVLVPTLQSFGCCVFRVV